MSRPVQHEVASDLRFPIGRYQPVSEINAAVREEWIRELESLPQNLRNAVGGLSEIQLDTPYRPGGWTVRQVVHHLPDSHMNSYVRFRLAITEDTPPVKTYAEEKWAELPDAREAPIDGSLLLLDGLHRRFVSLLRSLTDEDFARTFRHPELGEIRLDWTLGLYAWHSRHHVAHITTLRVRENW
ncbi:MAG: YfiT family bacillithiol transferase [Bryobacteraceae bacterium]